MGNSVRIFLREAKSGRGSFCLRVIIDRKVKVYSLGKKLNVADWDKERERVKPSSQISRELNVWLNNHLGRAEKILLDLENSRLAISIEAFNIRWLENSNKGMWHKWATEQALADAPQKSELFTKQVISILNKFNKWRPDIRFADINEELILQYERYLYNIGNKRNTVSNNLKRIRTFVRIAKKRGLIKENPFDDIPLKWQRTSRISLSFEDLQRFETSIDRLPEKCKRVVHQFLFSLYAGGLRWKDLCSLSWEEIKSDGIYKQQHKTGNMTFIPLTDLAKKHLPKPGIGKIFETISEQKFRDYLKLAADYANVQVNCSIKTARHSFISLSTALGMNFKIVSQIAGHSSIKMTENYYHPECESIKQEAAKWNKL